VLTREIQNVLCQLVRQVLVVVVVHGNSGCREVAHLRHTVFDSLRPSEASRHDSTDQVAVRLFDVQHHLLDPLTCTAPLWCEWTHVPRQDRARFPGLFGVCKAVVLDGLDLARVVSPAQRDHQALCCLHDALEGFLVTLRHTSLGDDPEGILEALLNECLHDFEGAVDDNARRERLGAGSADANERLVGDEERVFDQRLYDLVNRAIVPTPDLTRHCTILGEVLVASLDVAVGALPLASDPQIDGQRAVGDADTRKRVVVVGNEDAVGELGRGELATRSLADHVNLGFSVGCSDERTVVYHDVATLFRLMTVKKEPE